MNWAVRSLPLRVQAFGGKLVHTDAETIDHAMVNVEYANGVKGVLMLSLFTTHFAQLEIGALCDRGKIESLQLHGQLGEEDLLEEIPKTRPLPGLACQLAVEMIQEPGEHEQSGSPVGINRASPAE